MDKQELIEQVAELIMHGTGHNPEQGDYYTSERIISVCANHFRDKCKDAVKRSQEGTLTPVDQLYINGLTAGKVLALKAIEEVFSD